MSLREAAAVAEEESEVIAETFLAGKMDIDLFLQEYTASRMVLAKIIKKYSANELISN